MVDTVGVSNKQKNAVQGGKMKIWKIQFSR